MPLTALTVTTSSRVTPPVLPTSGGTAADPTNFNSFANDGNTLVLVTNNDGSVTRNVTVPVPVSVDGTQTVTSRTHAIPITQCWVFGPYPVAIYGSTVEFRGDNANLKFNVVRPGLT